ncbi:MAG: adenosyl-hopene transferase HpnH, partial [Solirubrobacterales bacterium]|nr:adenosyl-hopene transferase HpnH [Solirubrobacterales bacterium]
MGITTRQEARIGWYLLRQRLARREKFPLIVELEPLFQCNLACSGCGKIQHPEHVLRRRMPVAQAVGAIEESGAPMVSIAGGEPLVHPEIHEIAAQLVERKKFVYLCTNALLLERRLERFEPSPYFSWAIHLDGLRERHDESVEREGVFDVAVAAIRAAKARGFRVTTNTTFFTHDSPKTVREVLDFINDELEVDQMMISPA